MQHKPRSNLTTREKSYIDMRITGCEKVDAYLQAGYSDLHDFAANRRAASKIERRPLVQEELRRRRAVLETVAAVQTSQMRDAARGVWSQDDSVKTLKKIVEDGMTAMSATIYDPDTGKEIPAFDPKCANTVISAIKALNDMLGYNVPEAGDGKVELEFVSTAELPETGECEDNLIIDGEAFIT